jgi:4-aminobutyrate aminotransferase-like enzyme
LAWKVDTSGPDYACSKGNVIRLVFSDTEVSKIAREHLIGLQHRSLPVLIQGKGAVVVDAHEKEYIDCHSGPSVLNVGYCHPTVVEAIEKQVRKLNFAPIEFFNVPLIELAKKLAELAPEPMKMSFFCNSGAEATEGAVKLAKKYSFLHGRSGANVVALMHSTHGRLGLSLSLTGHGDNKRGLGMFANYPGIIHVPPPYCYRCPLKYPECNMYCAAMLEENIECAGPGNVAAFLYEPILAGGGIIVPPEEYHSRVARICRDNEVALIIDEIQVGIGRTGKMFASEHWDIRPDVMTVAKALGGGMAIAAFMASQDFGSAFEFRDHMSTFGGNPVACAAAVATLQTIEKERLIENAQKVGEDLKQQLTEMQRKHTVIGDVRGKGLLIGVELILDAQKTPASGIARKVVAEARKRGVLLGGVVGPKQNVLRLTPVLTITSDQAAVVVGVLDQALTVVEPH